MTYLADRFKGRALPRQSLLLARLGRRVYVGFEGRGYVRLSLPEARGVAIEIARLVGEREWTPPEVDE